MHDTKALWFTLINSLRTIFVDSWIVKVIVTALTAAWISNALLIVLIAILVAIDTLTKLGALVTLYVSAETGKHPEDVTKSEILRNLFAAIHPAFITSKGFKFGLFLKIILYALLILVALFLEQSPKKVIFGIDALKLLADGIFVAMVCTELYSILENFRDMGSKVVGRFQDIICTLLDRIGAGKFTATLKLEQKED